MIPPGLIETFVLALLRVSAMVLAAPLLGTGSLFSGYRAPVIVSLTVAILAMPGTSALGAAAPSDSLTFALCAMRELMIGIGFAFVLQAVMLAIGVGGG